MSKAPENPRKALGKGLSALLPAKPPAPPPEAAGDVVLSVPLDLIDANPHQPRSVFQAERLQELAESIKANGILQPLLVRRSGGRFQLVAGERRWRAARMAGLAEVPVIVRDFADQDLLEVTLVENIQREDLNPMEVAHAYERLSRDLGLTHEEIARRTGKDRVSITNMLRLLRLPLDVQVLLAERRLSMGHARALLSLPTPELQREVAERTSAQGLSVRQVERLTQRMLESREPKTAEAAPVDPNVRAALAELERVLATKVRIVEKGKDKGRIEIDYYSQDDLDRIYLTIVGEPESA